MPCQCIAAARDDARTTFQAAVVLNVNQAVVAERVDARGTDERAKLDGAVSFAHIMIDRNMALGVNLVGVETEFGFDVYWHCFLELYHSRAFTTATTKMHVHSTTHC
jgi:hypothetical protein